MARKRFIKPEFFKDPDLADLPIEARYLYAGLWPWMDRQGVVESDSRLHRANVFPYDEKVKVSTVEGWIDQLINAGFLIKFSWQGKTLLFCPKFSKHQKPYSDEKSNFEVTQEFLDTLTIDAVLPPGDLNVTSTKQQSNPSLEVRVRDEVRDEERRTKKRFDFEKVYRKFPRREGKSRGMESFETQILTDQDFADLETAVDHYSQLMVLRKSETKHILLWSTFANRWRDYIERPEELDKPKPKNYSELTTLLYTCAQHLSSYSSPEQYVAYIGDDWEWISRTGIMRKIREGKDDSYTRAAITKELREHYMRLMGGAA